ncbi:MAG: thioredoxin domain-containing protein [Nitrospinae bacterium]|nr:thioredoxin domain-containing protein [Nitrospinota bacterium]
MKKNNELTVKNGPLEIMLYVVAAFGAALAVVTELSHHYPAIMELCGGTQSGCADVASTPFAKLFGVPVTYWGLLTYVTFVYILRYFPVFTLPMAAVLMGAEFYFLWVMAYIIQVFCMFCLVQFGTVAVLFALALVWSLRAGNLKFPGGIWAVPVIVLLSFGAFAAPVKLSAAKANLQADGLVTYEGNLKASLKVEIFSDYECGYCRKFEPEVEKLRKNHPEALIIYRDFIIPTHSVSPVAVSYANALAITRGPEVFLAARKAMFENQEKLYGYLKERLPDVNFTEDLKTKINAKVDADLKRAQSLGIYQTPSIAISKGDKLTQVVRGFAEYEKLAEFLK